MGKYILMCFLWYIIPHASGQTTVTNTLDSGPGSLRQIVFEVPPGGVIFFNSSLSSDTIELTSGEIVIDKDLTIVGLGPGNSTISAGGQFRIFRITDNTKVTLIGLSLIEGAIANGTLDRYAKGGGIYSDGYLTLDQCSVKNCTALEGAGIWADTLTIYRSEITHNQASVNGGGIYGNVIKAFNSTISSNQASGRYSQARQDSTFIKGCAGGIFSYGGLNLTQCTLTKNSCTKHGGAVYAYGVETDFRLNIVNSIIAQNESEIGGGIYEDFTMIDTFINNMIGDNIATDAHPDFFNGGMWINANNVKNNIIAISENASGIPGENNQIGNIAQPIFIGVDTLKNNGGPLQTMALLECSPAIDNGYDSGTTSFDQRGFPRNIGLTIDVGPFEYEDPYGQDCIYNPLENYTILAQSKVELKKNNTVLRGGVGLLDSTNSVKIHDNSEVTAISTFVKAKNIDIDETSTVTFPIFAQPEVQLPKFKINNYDSGDNEDAPKNTVHFFTDSIYEKVNIKENATGIFTRNRVFIKDLELEENSRMQVALCSEFFVEDLIDIKENATVNLANNGLNIYARHAHIDEGAAVTANIFTTTHTQVNGKDDNPTKMNGQFIASEIEGDDHVVWNLNNHDECEGFIPADLPVCDSLIVDAGINKGVLFGGIGNFFDRYSCVLLNASVSGGSGVYSYEWTPSIGLNATDILRPEACPKTNTTYVLTVKDFNGCVAKDSVTIQAISLIDLLLLPRCNGMWRIEMCDIVTNERICANVFSSSESSGFGPNLNKGNTIGQCNDDDIYDETDDSSLGISKSSNLERNENGKVQIWPNPSSQEVTILIPKVKNLDFTLSDLSGRIINEQPEKIIPSNQGDIILIYKNLPSGIYLHSFKNDHGKIITNKIVIID